MALAITLIFSIIVAVFVIVGFIVGYRRGVVRSAIYFGTIVLSFILALALAYPVSKSICDMLGNIITGLIPAEIFDAAAELPEIAALTRNLPAMIISPVVFSVLFIITSLLTLVVYTLVSRLALSKAARTLKPAGGTIGAIAGALCFFCLFVPVAGYGRVATDAISVFPEVKTPEYVQYVEPIIANPILKAVGAVGGDAVFDTLTSADIAHTRISASKELSIVFKTAAAFSTLSSEDQAADSQAIGASLESAIYAMSDSSLIPMLAGSVLSDMAEAWQNGETYLGIAPPEADPSTEKLMDALLHFMATTTKETFRADMMSIKDIISVINKYDVLSSATDYSKLLDVLSSEGLANDLFASVASNPRLYPFIPAIVDLGISSLATTLEIPENDAAIYDMMVYTLAAALKDASALTDHNDQDQFLTQEFHTAFADSGVGFSEDAARLISQYMYADFSNLTPNQTSDMDMVTLFVEEFMSIAFDISTEAASAGSSFGIIFVSSSTTRTSSNAEALKNLLISLIPKDAFGNPDYVVLGNVTPDQIVSLVSSSEFESANLTLEDFAIDTDAWKDADSETVYEEAQKIADGIKLLAGVAKYISELESNDAQTFITSVDLSQVGAAIDCFKETSIMEESAHLLLKALLSSDMMGSSGIMTEESADVIYDIMSGSDSASYENLLGTVQSTAEMIIISHAKPNAPDTSIPGGSASTDVYTTVRDALTWLINHMSPESAQITKQILSPELLANIGLAPDISDKLTQAFHALIDELLAASATDAAACDKEAAAITQLLNYMAAYSSNPTSSIFGTVLEDADKFVNTTLKSNIAMNILGSIVYDGDVITNDPLGIASIVSAEDKLDLTNALQQYASENGIDTGDRRIVTIKALFGIK